MPIDAIGDLNLRIAETEAQGIEKRAGMKQEREQALATGIGESIKGGLDSAEVLQKQAIDAQMKKEANELLKSGVAGVTAYANEVGLDPTLYQNLAKDVKSPEGFKPIYQLINKKAEKDAVTNSVTRAMATINDDVRKAITTSDPKLIAQARNKVALAMTNAETDEARKQLQAVAKTLDDASTRTSKKVGKDAIKGVTDLRKLFSAESKGGDEILRQTDVLRSAFNDGAFKDKEGNVNRVGSDQALIMTFNKILDPTSVVRESEFNRTPEAAGAMNRAQGWFDKLIEGGSGLTEIGRKAIFKMSELISQGAMTDRFIKIREFEGIDPDNIEKIVPGFAKYADDYREWLADPEKYKKRIASELTKTLDMAQSEETKGDNNGKSAKKKKEVAVEKTKVAEKTRTKEEIKTSLATKKARLAELKAKQGAK